MLLWDVENNVLVFQNQATCNDDDQCDFEVEAEISVLPNWLLSVSDLPGRAFDQLVEVLPASRRSQTAGGNSCKNSRKQRET